MPVRLKATLIRITGDESTLTKKVKWLSNELPSNPQQTHYKKVVK